jgi:tetratricopeptide (TPR) repeat protein
VYRLLGLTPGPDIGLPAAASLTALPTSQVRILLRQLAAAHLVHEQTPGRYRMHDLVRLYAAERANTVETDDDRRAALHRVLDHHLHSAHAAALTLFPNRNALTLAPPRPGVTAERFADYGQARAWCTVEQPALLALIRRAAGTGFDAQTWQLAWSLAPYLDLSGRSFDWVATAHAALDAGLRLGDLVGQAEGHHSLGRAYTKLGHDSDAEHHLRRAVNLLGELGDVTGQAFAHLDLARLLARTGRLDQALDRSRQALDLCNASGNRVGQGSALNAIGWYHALLGDYEQALTYCQHAIELHQEVGGIRGYATAWDSLGYVHHHLGHHHQALSCYYRALDLHRQAGDRYYEADSLIHLGDTFDATGDPAGAHRAWRQALTILDELHHPDARLVRARLGRPRTSQEAPPHRRRPPQTDLP